MLSLLKNTFSITGRNSLNFDFSAEVQKRDIHLNVAFIAADRICVNKKIEY